jgi:hypothetical protein
MAWRLIGGKPTRAFGFVFRDLPKTNAILFAGDAMTGWRNRIAGIAFANVMAWALDFDDLEELVK